MKNPEAWDRFCAQFDEILSPCLPYHARLVQTLIQQDWGIDCPNMLFYGATGFPISVLLDHMFRGKYGAFTRTHHQIANSLDYYETQYFFEFDFQHPNFTRHSEECIELIQQIIRTPCIRGDRHIILLKNVDGVAQTAKQMFRVLLERYSKHALFICTTHIVSSLEPPLKSRFMMVRIPLAEEAEVRAIVTQLGYPPPEHSSRNLYRTLLMMELDDQDTRFHYSGFANATVAAPTLEGIRQMANKICQTNISFRNIVMDLLYFQKTDAQRYQLIDLAAHLEHMLACTSGGRQVLYIERLLCAAFL